MTKIVGTKIKQGSMITEQGEQITWDKCRISIIQDGVPGTFGLSADVINIKREDFKRITGYEYADHMKLVDKEVDLGYILVEAKPVLNSIKVVSNQPNK